MKPGLLTGATNPSSMGLTIQSVKVRFFDRALAGKIDPAVRSVLSRAGAFIRGDVRKSIKNAVQRRGRRPRQNTQMSKIRPRKVRIIGASKPGEPPRSWTGLLRDNVYFVVDGTGSSVVIGPSLLRRHGTGTTPVPSVLEFGGRTVFERRKVTRNRTKRGRFAVGSTSTVLERRNITIAARPYMRPALEKNLPKFPQLFSNIVR